METKIIRIRQLELSDTSQLAALANNKNIWDNLRDYFPHPYTQNDAKFFIELSGKQKPTHNFAVEFNGELCGVVGLVAQKDVYKKTAEIGYWIGEGFWGKGIASEAVRLLTAYGFSVLGFVRIFSGVFEYNIASMKVLEKSGFKKEAIFKDAIYKNGKIYNEHRYYLLNREHAV
ncbi:GNAT family N-acetyltransferase [Flavobacteriaceae bacterium TP-CH-4]|uniref:GNAT family N-acetyltransferase n=1 Tax=Pelagihabitans pacificus TaxID=2696054 RepID=A0A967E4Y3_9FLAO|nr:GNAT family protein [Pelagihabitans pacificus]NHF58862.1 GNAT family N-acetyltransferase [Pelagihabitans pacificus]